MAKRVSKYLVEYRKQRKRVTNLLTRERKKGYFFDFELPTITKKPTKRDVERLKKITPETLRKTGYYVDMETGEAFPATEHFKQKRREAARRAAQSRKRLSADVYDDLPLEHEEPLNGHHYLINKLRERLGGAPVNESRWWGRRAAARELASNEMTYVLSVLENTVASEGEAVVANRIYERIDKIDDVIDRLIFGYYDHEILSGEATLLNAIRGRTMTAGEAREYGDLNEPWDQ